jgi:biotin carboxyl carrier protein
MRDPDRGGFGGVPASAVCADGGAAGFSNRRGDFMKMRITVDGQQYDVNVEFLDAPPSYATPISGAQGSGAAPVSSDSLIECPIAGSVIEVLVKPGEVVRRNDPLFVIEALKVESKVVAPRDGVIAAVLVNIGDRVTAGQTLAHF